MKIGYSVADVEGFYFHTAIGVRFAVGKTTGFNFGLGYTVQNEIGWHSSGGVSLKIGLDF